MPTLLRDLRHGVRRFRTDGAVSATVVLTLTITIAACTAIFSVADGVLLRPLPYTDPAQLVSIGHRSQASATGPMLVSVPGFRDYAQRTHSFSSVAVEREVGMNLTGTGAAERVPVLRVSADWFTVYGAAARMGRTLLPDDQTPGHNNVVVLSYGFWQRNLGADRGIIGRSIHLNGESFVVVGVMAAEFRAFYHPHAELYVPAAFTGLQYNGAYASSGYNLTARLKRGISAQNAAAEMRAFSEHLKQDRPTDLPAGFSLSVRTLNDLATADLKPAILILAGAVAFLLLTACANIANLFLARAAVRMKEVALRTALGATRASLLRQRLAESVMLSLAGAVPGVLLARLGINALIAISPDLPRASVIGVDSRAVLFASVMSVVTGLLFGTVPAVQWSSPNLARALREGGQSGTQTRLGRRLLGGLVVAEVALALTLLFGAGLVFRTMSNLKAIDPGFDAHHAVSFKLSLPVARYPTDTAERLFIQKLTERLAGIPDVRAVGITSAIPFGGGWWTASILPEGHVIARGQELPNGDLRIVSPGFFDAMRIRVLQGRPFANSDAEGQPRVAVIDELFAKRYFGGRDAIGRRIALDPQPGQADSAWITVVGVVAHTAHEGLDATGRIQYYFPYAQRPIRDVVVAIGTTGNPTRVIPSARAIVGQRDPDLPLASVATIDALIDASLGQRQLLLVLLAGFSIIAVVLASVGIYGLVSYSVSRRARELGIRRALGGSRSRLLWLVLNQSLSLITAGVMAGLALAFMLTRLLASELYSVTPTDPATFVIGTSVLFGVALVATLVPAWRATTVSPLIALRSE
jgi:putative ABC transport system permease protein